MAGNSLRFSIEVQADEAGRALQAISTAVNQAGASMRTALVGVGPAAKTAGNEITSLGERMTAFARMQRSEARTAGFFVNELANIVPVSGSVKIGLEGIAGAIIGGAGVAGAIQLAITGVRLLAEHFRAEAEAAKKAQEAADKHAQGLRDLRFETDAFLRGLAGVTPALEWRYQKEHELSERTLADRRRLAALTGELATVEAEIARERIGDMEAGQGLSAADQKRNAILAEQVAIQGRLNQAKADAAEIDRQFRERQAGEEAKGGGEARAKVDAERLERRKQIAEAIAEAEIAAANKAFEAELALTETLAQAEIDAANKVFEAEYEAEQKALEAADKLRDKELQDFKKNFVTPMVSAFTSGMRGMIEGTKSFGDFMRGMMGSLLDVIIAKLNEWLVAEITAALTGKAIQKMKAVSEISANAGIAGSAAAAQIAMTPAFLTAPAVAAGIAEAVLAAMMPFAAARQGFDVPMGFQGLVQLHSREMVLPEQYADVIRSGGAGGSYQFTIVTPDRAGVERLLMRNDGTVVRTLSRAARRGRRSAVPGGRF